MRRGTVPRRGFGLAVVLAMALLAIACARIDEKKPREKAQIPERYENWTITYSTGESKVYSQALGAATGQLLFEAKGLDYGLYLRVLSDSSVAYGALRDGRETLAVFSPETGTHETITRDLRGGPQLVGETLVYVTSEKSNGDVLWAWRPGAKRPKTLMRAKGLVCGRSAGASRPALFSIARSDPAIDPVDQDLYYLSNTDAKPRKVDSAPHTFAFSEGFLRGDILYYVMMEQGGEDHGVVRMWSEKTGEIVDLAEHAYLRDVGDDGSLLLMEPAPMQPAASSMEPRERQRLRVVMPDGSDRVLSEYPSTPLAWFVGQTVVVAADADKAQALEAFDPATGKRRVLWRSEHAAVWDVEKLDAEAFLCVVNGVAPNGLPTTSKLMWMPLNGRGDVTIAETDSGFIHVAPPQYRGN